MIPKPKSRPVEKVIEAKKRESAVGAYNFPGRDSYHNVVLMFRSFNHKSTGGLIKRGSVPDSRIKRSIVLPLPTNLQDTFSVSLNPFELGISGATALEAMSSDGRSALLAGAENLDVDSITGAISTAKTAGAFAARNIIDEIGIGGLGAATDLAQGAAINNHVTLRFEGVNLKNHTFNWSLSPRNVDEAETLKNIVQYIRNRMLPSYQNASGDATGGGSALDRALLSYPSLVDVFFIGANQDYFYYFKPCMIQNFTTDYAPNGLAMNVGGKPSVVNLSMQLSEAQIHTSSDYPING